MQGFISQLGGGVVCPGAPTRRHAFRDLSGGGCSRRIRWPREPEAMDPITMIVAALAAGAAEALKDTAAAAVKDAYAGLKGFLARKYPKVGVEAVEEKPESEARRAVVAEDLADAGADKDEELLAAVGQLVEALRTHAPEAGASVGVDLEKVSAEYLRLRDIASTGTGVRVKEGEFRGGIDIEGVRAGGGGSSPNP